MEGCNVCTPPMANRSCTRRPVHPRDELLAETTGASVLGQWLLYAMPGKHAIGRLATPALVLLAPDEGKVKLKLVNKITSGLELQHYERANNTVLFGIVTDRLVIDKVHPILLLLVPIPWTTTKFLNPTHYHSATFLWL